MMAAGAVEVRVRMRMMVVRAAAVRVTAVRVLVTPVTLRRLLVGARGRGLALRPVAAPAVGTAGEHDRDRDGEHGREPKRDASPPRAP